MAGFGYCTRLSGDREPVGHLEGRTTCCRELETWYDCGIYIAMILLGLSKVTMLFRGLRIPCVTYRSLDGLIRRIATDCERGRGLARVWGACLILVLLMQELNQIGQSV